MSQVPPVRTSIRDSHAAAAAIALSLALLGVMHFLDGRLAHFERTPDGHVDFVYAWQLAHATLGTRMAAWVPYALHQASMWGLIYYAQTRVGRYGAKLHWVNLAALAVNFGFAGVHLVQTHLTYDGLAQDVHEASALASVTVMLIVVLIMENRRRGLFWGYEVPIGKRAADFFRRYHGYYFCWAITYTFWYHPTVSSPGHLAGFAYMYLLLLQGSLFFTRLHTNRWWTLSMEVSVIAHSAAVALTHGLTEAYRFMFGFAAIFVITQMHGLRFSQRTRVLILAGYVIAVVSAYRPLDYVGMSHTLRIPGAEYILGAVLWALLSLVLWIVDKLSGDPAAPAAADMPSEAE